MSELFLKIVNMSISASWLVLVVLAFRFLFRKAPKWVNVLLWGIVAVRLIFPISIESALSLIPSAETISPEIMMDWTPEISTGMESVDRVVNPIITETFAPEPIASANPLQILIPVFSIIWITGMCVLALYTVISYWRLQRKVVEAVILRENIFQSENVGSPFVLGIIKPRIYLPYNMDNQDLEHVVAHEQAHIRRRDHWWKPLGFLLLMIHWFNPLMWVAYILLCRDIELACDEKVIKEMGNEQRADYTQALVSCSVNRRMIAACPLAFGEVGVKERVRSVMNYKKPAFWVIVASVIACAVVAVCFLTNPVEEEPFNEFITWEMDAEYPGAVMDIVNDYVMQQVEYYNDLGSGDTAIGGEYSILEAKVVGLTKLLAGTVAENHSIEFCRLEYRLLPSEPSHVVLAGGMQMDGDWITEWDSTGQPYIAILCDSSSGKDVWTMIGVTNTDVIDHEYNTAEMLEQYHDKYVAAAMELYKAYGSNESLNQYGTAVDVSNYLELAADTEFQNMNLDRQTSILVEYEDLLDDYTFIARESKDGTTAYIVGQYNGNPLESPLHGMYSIDMYTGEGDYFRFLYREEAAQIVEAVVAANQTEFPPSAGYRIEDSQISWTDNSGCVLIQPKTNELFLDVPWNRYFYTPNGREYIADAVSRGIDVCGRTDTYLYIYRISEQFGEISERIALTEAEAQAILAEERVKITDGFGFSASLHIDGQTTYYNEREGIPQTVLDLAVEKCDYRFGDPSYITDTIREARLDCDWLDAPLYADAEDLPRLREILKNAEHGYVGSCGYGAKLTLTFTGGEKLVLFKGTDGCDTIVFGSYGGYFLGEKENIEFWEMFGLDPDTKTPLRTASQTLSLNDVIMLSQKGYDLTWDDFDQYRYIETGSGLYIRVYEINEMFSLWIGGFGLDSDPMYIYLSLADDLDTRIDIRDGGVEEFITKDYSETLLNRAIYDAIINCNRSEKTMGLNHCASFVMLDKEEVSGTPVVGSTDHVGVVTVYGLALHHGYDLVDDNLYVVEGSHTPVAITFDVLNGKYSLKEYWRPGDGIYYAPDIREKFPDHIEDEVMDTQKYYAAQNQECYVQAMRNNGVEVSEGDNGMERYYG